MPGIDELNGAGVFYGASPSDARQLSGEDVYIVGGGNSAGQAAMHLSRHAHCVHILVRGPSLADTMSDYLRFMVESDEHHNIKVLTNTEVVECAGEGRLQRLTPARQRPRQDAHRPRRGAVRPDRRSPAHRLAPDLTSRWTSSAT